MSKNTDAMDTMQSYLELDLDDKRNSRQATELFEIE